MSDFVLGGQTANAKKTIMRYLLLALFAVIVLLASSGCTRSPSNNGVSRIQSPTLSEPVGNTGLGYETGAYRRFDP